MSDHKTDAFAYSTASQYASQYKMFKQPNAVGYWVLPGSVEGVGTYMIGCHKKPRWLTIKLMNWLLEFKYKESI